jgi:hypothetical protein
MNFLDGSFWINREYLRATGDYEAFNLSNRLISYDSKKGFKIVEKYKTRFPWMNEIIKFFRYVFCPQFHIKNVWKGFAIEAKKLSTTNDKIAYFRLLQSFKENVIHRHHAHSGGWRTPIKTTELDKQLVNLAEEMLQQETSSPVKDEVREWITEGKKLEITEENLLDFLEISKGCNISLLTVKCELKVKEFLWRFDWNTLTIDKIHFFHQIKEIVNPEIQQAIEKWFNTNSFGYLVSNLFQSESKGEIKLLIEFAKTHGYTQIIKACEVKFIKFNNNKLCFYLNNFYIPKNKTELISEQRKALSFNSESLDQILRESLDLGLITSPQTIFSFIINHAIYLCVKFCDEGLQNPNLQADQKQFENICGLLQQHAAAISQISDDKKFKLINAIFDNSLFKPGHGELLLKYIFSDLLWNWISKPTIYEWKVPAYYSERNISQLSKDMSVDQIIFIYRDIIKLANHLHLEEIEYYFSYSVLFKTLKKSLSPENEQKNHHLHLIRTILYPVLFSLSSKCEKFYEEVIEFEQFLSEDIEKLELVFNDEKTSDVKLKMTDSTILHLHKEVLKKSPYFEALFENRFNSPDLTEILLEEENTSGFINFIEYLYKNDLIINTENILSIFNLLEKYQAGSYLPLSCRLSKEIHSLISKFTSKSQEDGIGLEEWKMLIKIAQTYKDKYLIQKIKEYILFSVSDTSVDELLENATLDQIIFTYQRTIQLINHLHLDEIEDYFSYSILFKTLKKFLSAENEQKNHHIHLIRTVLYPALFSLSSKSEKFHKQILKFEQFLSKDIEKLELVFNDEKTSDVKLKLTDSTILYLHKEVLKKSPYFEALFENRLNNPKVKETFVKKENTSDFIIFTEILSEEEDTSNFITFIEYLYKNDLIINTENILSIFNLSEKYQAGSYLPLSCHISQEIHSLISKFTSKSQEDGIGLEEWKMLIEIAQTYKDKYLIQKIREYILFSVKEFLKIQSSNQSSCHPLELNITTEQAEERQEWLDSLNK